MATPGLLKIVIIQMINILLPVCSAVSLVLSAGAVTRRLLSQMSQLFNTAQVGRALRRKSGQLTFPRFSHNSQLRTPDTRLQTRNSAIHCKLPYMHPILATSMSVLLLCPCVRHTQGTPLDSETGWTGDFLSKTNLPN